MIFDALYICDAGTALAEAVFSNRSYIKIALMHVVTIFI